MKKLNCPGLPVRSQTFTEDGDNNLQPLTLECIAADKIKEQLIYMQYEKNNSLSLKLFCEIPEEERSQKAKQYYAAINSISKMSTNDVFNKVVKLMMFITNTISAIRELKNKC